VRGQIVSGGIGAQSSREDAVRVDLADTTRQDTRSGYASFIGIENVTSGDGNDTILGSDVANVLDGVWGNDTLEGRGGNDTLIGSDGNDRLSGGDGNDVYDGGAGIDTAVLDSDVGKYINLGVTTLQNTREGNDTFTASRTSPRAAGRTRCGAAREPTCWTDAGATTPWWAEAATTA
jgi:Ca2+-binding RTX toxin-like protein